MHRRTTRFILFFGAWLSGCSGQPSSQPPTQTVTPAASTQATTPAAGSANQLGAPSNQTPSNAQSSVTPQVPEGWVTVTDLDGRLSAKMPSPPKIEEKEQLDTKVRSQKVLTPGIVWNVLVTTYTQQVIDREEDSTVLLERLSQIYEKQKVGAKRVYLKRIEETKYPTVEHRYEYQFAKNPKTGEPISWFAIHHHTLVGTSVCTLFIDAQDAVYNSDSSKYDKQIDGFFASLQIRDE